MVPGQLEGYVSRIGMEQSQTRAWTIVLTLNHTNYRRSWVVVIFAYLGSAPEPQLPRLTGYGGRVEVDDLLA